MSEPDEPQAFPLFNGLARPALILGVPMVPLMVMAMVVAAIAMNLGLIWALLAPPAWFVMMVLTKHDVNFFRLLWLAIDTKLRNPNRAFWKASTYSHNKPRRR